MRVERPERPIHRRRTAWQLFALHRLDLERRAALATAMGNNGGVLIQAVLVAFGLGAVVARSIVVFSVLKFAGALYLIYLGIQTWRHRGELAVTDAQQRPPANLRRIVRQASLSG